MTAEEIHHQIQLNILKLGLIEKQIIRIQKNEHAETIIENLKKRKNLIIEKNNNYLLQLELLE